MATMRLPLAIIHFSVFHLLVAERIAEVHQALSARGPTEPNMLELVTQLGSEESSDGARGSVYPDPPGRLPDEAPNMSNDEVAVNATEFAQFGASEAANKSNLEAGQKTEESAAGSGAGAGSSLAANVDFRKVLAEFLGMTLFIFFSCGSAMGMAMQEGSAWVLQVSLTFGLSITVLAYTFGHYSGGQFNCAVTLGLVIQGTVGVTQGLYNSLAQLLGTTVAGMMLKAICPDGKDRTHNLACNGVGDGWSPIAALVAEFMGTFFLMIVVLETAVSKMSPENGPLAPIAIGTTVFLAHSALIPIDGCSINPTRSLGTAIVQAASGSDGSAVWKDMWIFILGPLAGAAAAAFVFREMQP